MPYRKPLGNMFADQLFATGSTVDILKWDSTCLDSMVVPDGIDKTDVINCILERFGNQTLAHPDPGYMYHYVGTWSKRRLPIWEKLLASTQFEYNPIWNFDRTESYTDKTEHNVLGTTDVKTQGTGTASQDGSVDRSEVSEQKVSAENVSSYQPDARTDNGINETSTTSATSSSSETNSGRNTVDEDTTVSHEARLTGNIGVTTTQQMIEAERKVVRYSVIEEIAEDYRDTFCLSIY